MYFSFDELNREEMVFGKMFCGLIESETAEAASKSHAGTTEPTAKSHAGSHCHVVVKIHAGIECRIGAVGRSYQIP